MLKRLLNIFTIISSIYLIVLVGAMATGGVSNWIVFVGSNLLPLIGAYLAIAIINYVVYNQVTIWHKHTSSNDAKKT
jgi:hypothetical protein